MILFQSCTLLGIISIVGLLTASPIGKCKHGLALKTWRGTFLSVRDDGVITQSPSMGEHERLERTREGAKSYFTTFSGNHVSARDNGSVIQVPQLADWEKFDVINDSDGVRVSFHTVFNKHISAREDGSVVQVPQLADWEKYEVVCHEGHREEHREERHEERREKRRGRH